MKNRRFISLWVAVILLTLAASNSPAAASVQIPQTALDPALDPIISTTKFTTPLPFFGPGGAAPRVGAGTALGISAHEFQSKILPDAFYASLPASVTPITGLTFNPQLGSWVFGYKVGAAGTPYYPGFTVEAQKGTATQVTYTNNLGTANAYPILQKYITFDQSLMWANPLDAPNMVPNPVPPPATIGNPNPYAGPHPMVVHLHGGEVRSDSDGGPEQWWTPGAEGTGPLPAGTYRGSGYVANGNVYNYPNAQEAATLWFHDHLMGGTRLNVYAGTAAFWFIRDAFDTGLVNNPLGLPGGAYEVELALQDRQFDTNGQLLWPDGSPTGAPIGLNGPPPNPEDHPYWNPEFFGDVVVVNGRSWPFLQVEPRRYRFRMLGGANARFWELHLENRAVLPASAGPPIYVIGTDGGLLDQPAITSTTPTNLLLIAPGERYDVIIDFTAFNGQTLTLVNSANAPFPGGAPPDPATTEEVMQFKVTKPLAGPDSPFNPATPGATLRGGAGQPPAIVRLADGNGGIAPGVTVHKKRQLFLKEIMGMGGPLEVLVNNTKFSGTQAGTTAGILNAQKIGMNYITEFPQVGSTEIWEIINNTADAHPMHLHLVQFQLLNRESFDTLTYQAAYDAKFPGGVMKPGYGPPMPYNSTGTPGNPNYTGFYGGNPDVTPHLIAGTLTVPLPQEKGWKDTAVTYPGQVTRYIVRFGPQDAAVGALTPGTNPWSFDPTYGPGYVWHCHIVDHEDNEMMRPFIPTKKANNTFYTSPTWAYELLLIP